MELILNVIIIWASLYLGYKMAGGKDLEIIPAKLKAIIRTPAEEADFERKLKERR